MKLKRKVSSITEQNGLVICLGDNRYNVPQEDAYLVEALSDGIYEEEKLKELIMKHDGCDEIVAGLVLAKFILDYHDYLEEDRGYYEITM